MAQQINVQFPDPVVVAVRSSLAEVEFFSGFLILPADDDDP
jgi:hypothetical protein